MDDGKEIHPQSLEVPAPLLLAQLNQLLAALALPLALTSPLELTPLLLIAVVESILRDRLPIADDVRAQLATSKRAKEHGVKIFLGVMQADLLGADVGLSAMDPRRLARGEQRETLYVARLLCWYGRRTGLVDRPGRGRRGETSTRTNNNNNTGRSPPSTLTTLTPTQHSMTMTITERAESVTSVSSQPRPRPPRCIHEVPSLVLSPLSPRLTALPSPPFPSALLEDATVRYEGTIARVDEDSEIALFEASREASQSRSPSQSQFHSPPPPPPHTAEDTRYAAARRTHVALLERRAQLLEQLARLQNPD